MTKCLLLLVLMLYCHILDDYVLQTTLSKLKQKQYWYGMIGPNLHKYEYDYLAALFFHALSWSITISIPAMVIYYKTNNSILGIIILSSIVVNTIIHAVVDHLKANPKIINLIVDQFIHMIQIVVYWLLIITMGGLW